jgi:hypothetical protein
LIASPAIISSHRQVFALAATAFASGSSVVGRAEPAGKTANSDFGILGFHLGFLVVDGCVDVGSLFYFSFLLHVSVDYMGVTAAGYSKYLFFPRIHEERVRASWKASSKNSSLCG